MAQGIVRVSLDQFADRLGVNTFHHDCQDGDDLSVFVFAPHSQVGQFLPKRVLGPGQKREAKQDDRLRRG